MRISPNILILLAFATLVGCAAPEGASRPERPDMDEVARLLNCPSDRTPTCIERINRPYRCYCMDEDALRAILEPEDY